jgi:hypothetical protein
VQDLLEVTYDGIYLGTSLRFFSLRLFNQEIGPGQIL